MEIHEIDVEDDAVRQKNNKEAGSSIFESEDSSQFDASDDDT